MKRFFLFLCLIPLYIFPQGETNNWYFGNGAAIKFNEDGTVTSLKESKITTFEGCATISNADANLLFYTDGISIFNSEHEIMENGNDLYGNPSNTQSAIIVPKPKDSNIYYVFTVDTIATLEDLEASYDGFSYSIVDMSFDNGFGRVVQKNIPLLEASAEKISAILKDCIDGSLWVITLSSEDGKKKTFELEDGTEYSTIEDYNTFHAFEVNQNGVSNTSIKSTFEHDSINRIYDVRGYLKFSPEGNKLASANQQHNGLFIYDFDKDTGSVFNEQSIDFQIGEEYYYVEPYGVEFSPNSKYLYTHALTYEYEEVLDSTFVASALLQYNINFPQISESEIVIEKDRNIFRGALQLGSNGMIYRTIANDYDNGINFLELINSPNLEGEACNYIHNAVELDGLAMQGLPPFIQSFFDKEDLVLLEDGSTTNSLTLGLGEEFTLLGEEYENAEYIWSKDGIVLNEINGNRYQISNVTLNNSGRYVLEINFFDLNQCSIVGEAIINVVDKFELGFPNFFTPNGDGINEKWHHLEKDNISMRNLRIDIYDRYGKLIKEIKSDGNGWDGNYNGKPMPSSGYWFRAILETEREFKGHFTLKR